MHRGKGVGTSRYRQFSKNQQFETPTLTKQLKSHVLMEHMSENYNYSAAFSQRRHNNQQDNFQHYTEGRDMDSQQESWIDDDEQLREMYDGIGEDGVIKITDKEDLPVHPADQIVTIDGPKVCKSVKSL